MGGETCARVAYMRVHHSIFSFKERIDPRSEFNFIEMPHRV